MGGIRRTAAYVHESCKEAWAKGHDGAVFDALPWFSLEKIVHCQKCGGLSKLSEIKEAKGNAERVRRLPYEGCGEVTEVILAQNQRFLCEEFRPKCDESMPFGFLDRRCGSIHRDFSRARRTKSLSGSTFMILPPWTSQQNLRMLCRSCRPNHNRRTISENDFCHNSSPS